MSYHGYDVTDYTAVNPQYGTLDDFDRLVSEARARGITIYLDYVMNHTGRNHPWFTQATSSLDNPYRDYYTFSQDPAADIQAGRVPMIASEGAAGYKSGEWFAVPTEAGGYYTFTLDWSSPSQPTVTVTQASRADVDADNTSPSTSSDKYLYYGDAVCKKFYDKGNGIYELTVDFASSWGFLIRTSNTQWGNYKYGAARQGDQARLGEPFALKQGENAQNILLEGMEMWYFHSAFGTRLVCRFELRSRRPGGRVARLSGHQPCGQGLDRPWGRGLPPRCREAHLPQCPPPTRTPVSCASSTTT